MSLTGRSAVKSINLPVSDLEADQVNPMAQTHSVIAMPWCARGDYPALLKLFSDPDTLPETYDAWLKRAECTESQMQKAGFGVARIWIRPVPFVAWCMERNVSPDQAARLTFANESARHPRAQP
jgi:hypothetical protein